jgi:predicted O-linked N-acetylglucosamine transferase (SPINDLY family)
MANQELLNRIAKLSKQALVGGKREAVDSFCRLGLMLNPVSGVFYHHLGLRELLIDDTKAALPLLQKAIEFYDTDKSNAALEAHRDTIIAYLMDKDYETALNTAQSARSVWPKDGNLAHLTAQAAEGTGDAETATACYELALNTTPADDPETIAETAFRLGTLFYRQHHLEKAYKAYRKVLDVHPQHKQTWCNLGNVLSDMARPAEAFKAYESALRIDPNYKNAHSNLLQTLHYLPDQTAASLLPPHQAWAKRHTPKTTRIPPCPPKRERLCVGLVSEDLRQHPVGFFCKGWFPHAREAGLDLVVYCSNRRNDELTYELKTHTSQWNYVDTHSDADLEQRIRQDAPDILIDLSGHTGRNRLGVFAEKPCAHQATWMGYVGTTGLSQIDGLIADRVHVPKLEDKAYAEGIWRMPNGYVCYAPPDYAPDPQGEAWRRSGHITFAAFHNPAKVNPTVIGTWAKIMREVDGSKICLTFRGYEDAHVQELIGRTFQAHGISPERVLFHGAVSHADLFALYNTCDFALDTFPYSGGLTTLEALWMGIPVITTPGRTFASRHSSSHLTFGGFSQDVTTSVSEYVRTAIAWAHSPLMRDADRRARRARFAASPLCNGQTFAKDLAALFAAKL